MHHSRYSGILFISSYSVFLQMSMFYLWGTPINLLTVPANLVMKKN